MPPDPSQSRPASSEPISLSQAVLAPLDAIFKAQIHAARSYINMLWQMAYQHIDLDEEGHMEESTAEEKKPYTFPLNFETLEGDTSRITTVNIPTIAMVPVMPLGVEEATIKFSMTITAISDHEQLQEAATTKSGDKTKWGKEKRPWYLVSNPVSLNGNIVSNNSSNSSVEINIKITKSPIPAALEKALTILTQNISINRS